jgi:hypothetical protein
VTATYFTICYIAMSLPVLVAGVAADRLGLGVVTAGYLVALTALVGGALVLGRVGETRADDLVADRADFVIEPDLAELASTA